MLKRLTPSIVRVHSQSGRPVSVGAFVGGKWVLTCAHVIIRALGLGKNQQEKPTGILLLDFPLVKSGLTLQARVISWDPEHDIAGLELEDELPAGVQPIQLVTADELWGHRFRVFGCPEGYDDGVWADGVLRGPVASGWLQIQDVDQTGYFVQPGFSGSPVWDEELEGVVGMIVAADTHEGVRAAFIIPADLLVESWPALQDWKTRSALLGKLVHVPDLPPHFLPRDESLEAIKAVLLGEQNQETVITAIPNKIGVQGMGGIGKTVLAAYIVRDSDIRRTFIDGVLWVTIGQEPVLIQLQKDLADALESSGLHRFESIEQGRLCLADLLSNKVCLLVLDDVWQPEHIQAFSVLGSRGRMLITTREAGLVTALGAYEHRLDVLTEKQALTLLSSWARVLLEHLPTEAEAVIEECGRLPLAIALSGAVVQGGVAWSSLLGALQKAQLELLDNQYLPYERHRSIISALKVSVDTLAVEQVQRLFELAVFPKDTLIPESVVAVLWRHTGELEEYESLKLLSLLTGKALVQATIIPLGRVIEIHDVQHLYLRRLLPEQRRTQILCQLVEVEELQVRDIIVNSLIEMGREELSETPSGRQINTLYIIRSLMAVKTTFPTANVLKRGISIIKRRVEQIVGMRYTEEVHARYLKDVALDVTYGLLEFFPQNRELQNILIDAFEDPFWEIRRKATRDLFRLWHWRLAEREELLDRVLDRVSLIRALVNSSYLQTTIDFGLRILFAHHQEAETLILLQNATQKILKSLPLGFIQAGVGIIPLLVRQLVKINSIDEIDRVLKHSEYKQTLIRLGLLLDPRRTATPQDMTIIRQALLGADNAETLYETFMLPYFGKNALFARLTRDFRGNRTFVEDIFFEAGPISKQWILAVFSFSRLSNHHLASPEEVYEVADRLSRTFVEDRDVFLASDWYDSGAFPLIHVSRVHCESSTAAIPIFEDLLRDAQDKQDWKLMQRLIIELAYAGHMYPIQVLQSLTVITDWEQDEIYQTMSDTLASIRFRYPDLCEKYLDKKGVGKRFLYHVRNNIGNPELAKLMDNLEINQFALHIFDDWPELLELVIETFKETQNIQNFQGLTTLFMHKILNIIQRGGR